VAFGVLSFPAEARMTKEELLKLAENVAMKGLNVEREGMRDRPDKTEDRIIVDAEYLIALGMWRIAKNKYKLALAEYEKEPQEGNEQ
jgi:hypothetical protein